MNDGADLAQALIDQEAAEDAEREALNNIETKLDALLIAIEKLSSSVAALKPAVNGAVRILDITVTERDNDAMVKTARVTIQ